jgi:hypothetical protein
MQSGLEPLQRSYHYNYLPLRESIDPIYAGQTRRFTAELIQGNRFFSISAK